MDRHEERKRGFSKRISELLNDLGMTNEEFVNQFAEKYGDVLSSKAVYKWRNGDTFPDTKRLQDVCEMCGDVSIDWLLTGNGSKYKSSSIASISEAPASYELLDLDKLTISIRAAYRSITRHHAISEDDIEALSRGVYAIYLTSIPDAIKSKAKGTDQMVDAILVAASR